MRILLYTGKGGVGKTSVAAATSLHLARRGYKTIVISTDAAHSLGDSLDMTLGPEPVAVVPNLWAHEVDVFHEMHHYWRTVQDWLKALMQWQGVEGVVAEEMAVVPGMEELMGLLQITRHQEEGLYDVVVVDCAPTAETLRLLSFPEMARWYMRKLFPLERQVAKAMGPLARGLLNIPVPGTKVFDTLQFLFDRVELMNEILVDPAITSIRLVVNPEKMVVKEALRTYTYLNLYGYHTDLIVCNRVLPDAVSDTFFDTWRATQQQQLQFIDEAFTPLPIYRVPLMNREVVGLDALEEMGRHLYGDSDPSQVLYQGRHQEIRQTDSGYVLELQVPFTSREEISLLQRGAEVVVQTGRYRRHVFLPSILAGKTVTQAKLEGSILQLRFQASEPSSSATSSKKGKDR